MTLKELRAIVNTPAKDESAQIFIEIPVGERTYYQCPVDAVRFEQDTYCSSFIIMGGQSDS